MKATTQRSRLEIVRQRRWAVAGACVVTGAVASCTYQGTNLCDPLSAVSGSSTIQCPQVSSVVVRPGQAEVGSAVALLAVTTDPPDAEPTVFSWSAPSGTFADSSSLLTTYTCETPGVVALTLKASRDFCTQTLSATVECLAPVEAGAD